MEVLIVAKTRMKDALCVGGLELAGGKSVRLLDREGRNQPIDTPFEVGQVWNLGYHALKNPKPPHLEDVLITTSEFVRDQPNLVGFLRANVPIVEGHPSLLFDGMVRFAHASSGYISRTTGIPSHSVTFWIPDQNLELQEDSRYYYFGEGNEVFRIKYVGTAGEVDTVLADTLVRISLARWWSPTPQVEERCYCQISGWYL